MKTLSSTLIAKAVAGFIVIVPTAILFIAGIEIYGMIEDISIFAKIELPFPHIINSLIVIALGVLVAFIVCLVTGWLMSTALGQRLGAILQKGFADKIPLLGLLKNLTLSFTGNDKSQLKPVEVDVQGSGACSYGFLMENLPDGRLVVFVPSAPAITMGQVFVLPAERVKLLDVPITAVINSITQWGVEASAIYRLQKK